MADFEKISYEVYKLERTLDDIKNAHDYLSEGFLVRFFKKGVLWLMEISMYFILVLFIFFLLWTVFQEEEMIKAIIEMLREDNCSIRQQSVFRDLMAIRVMCIIVAIASFAFAMMVRKIRRKNETVKYTLDMLEGTAEHLKERIVELRNGLNTEKQ